LVGDCLGDGQAAYLSEALTFAVAHHPTAQGFSNQSTSFMPPHRLPGFRWDDGEGNAMQ
jgi:hypothetical protein